MLRDGRDLSKMNRPDEIYFRAQRGPDSLRPWMQEINTVNDRDASGGCDTFGRVE